MRLTIESTTRVVELDGVPCREWLAVFQEKRRREFVVSVFVHRIMPHVEKDDSGAEALLESFERQFREEAPPRSLRERGGK